MQIDTNALMADANMINVLMKIPSVSLDLSKKYYPDGNKIPILCKYHNDKHFGSANLLVHGNFKGMHCFACGVSKSLIQMVQDYGNMNYFEACSFIAEDIGGISNYFIPGTETEYEKKHGISNMLEKAEYDFPAPLNTQELKLINMNPFNGKHYIPKREYDYKPKEWEIEKDEFVISYQEDNPSYDDKLGPEYLNFVDFVKNKKNPNGQDQSPFLYKYLVCNQMNGNPLAELYRTDKWTYWHMMVPKIIYTLDDVNTRLTEIACKKGTASEKYLLTKSKKQLEELLKRYTLSKESQESMRKEHFNRWSDSDFDGYDENVSHAI